MLVMSGYLQTHSWDEDWRINNDRTAKFSGPPIYPEARPCLAVDGADDSASWGALLSRGRIRHHSLCWRSSPFPLLAVRMEAPCGGTFSLMGNAGMVSFSLLFGCHSTPHGPALVKSGDHTFCGGHYHRACRRTCQQNSFTHRRRPG